MKFFKTGVVVLSLFLTFSVHSNIGEKPLIWSPEVMLSTKPISDIQISPNNESILFVVKEPTLSNENSSWTPKIYAAKANDAKTASPLPLSMNSSTQPRWSPNGKSIAFISTQDGSRNLYIIPVDGKEAKQITQCKTGVQTYSWSADSEKIAFVMSDQLETTKNKPSFICDEKKVINRLWMVDLFSSNPTPIQLTSDEYCVRGGNDSASVNTEFDWSFDSKKITFAYSPSTGAEDFYLNSSIATLSLETGKISPWEKKALYEAQPHYSPDGLYIAYLTDNNKDHRYSHDRQVAVRYSDGSGYHPLSQTYNQGTLLAGPNLLGWSRDNKNVLFYEPKGTKFHLMLIPTNGEPAIEIQTGETFFRAPSLSLDNSTLGFISETTSTPPEVYVSKVDNFTPIQVSNLNQPLLAYPKIQTELYSWTSNDGLTVEGLLTYPIDYEEGKQYPLLVVVHGGPISVFSETFVGYPSLYPIASFAQSGFFVFRPNPRGSTGYGKTFRWKNYNDWGGGDYQDIISGIYSLIAKGNIDAQRLGIMGWSYGGYMTAWSITQTAKFKAASIGAGMSNLVSHNGTSDLPLCQSDFLGNFYDNRELYEDRSPINFVPNIETPCLIQHGTNDSRVSVSQSHEFYHALKHCDKEAALLLYPGMGHGPSTPKVYLDVMQANVEWFNHHINATLPEA